MPHTEMPELERWVLHRLYEVDQVVRKAVVEFDFNRVMVTLHEFCAVDCRLSISISARTAFIATGLIATVAALPARCWSSCLRA